MPNIQYIGARYVPKFYVNPDDGSTEWKSGVPYEPLIIVTESGSSYTSKKPVPGSVGYPSVNPTYWVKTGDYNASITAMQAEISTIKSTLEDSLNNGLGYRFKAMQCEFANTYFDLLSGTNTYRSLQGVAYDSTRDRLAFLLIETGGSDVYMVTVDNSNRSNVITRKLHTNADMGHGNPFCYNPTIDKYLTCPDNDGGNKINIIDPETLDIVDVKRPTPIAGTTFEILSEITYDYDQGGYYVFTLGGLYHLREDFTIESYHSQEWVDALKCIDNLDYWNNLIPNGIVYYKDKIYIELGYDTNPRRNWLIAVNRDGSVFNTINLPNFNVNTEYEGVCVIDDVIRLFSHYTLFVDCALVLQDQNTDYINDEYMPTKPIAASTNLNDIRLVGKYFCNATDAATVTNSPITFTAFELDVKYISTALTQTLTITANSTNVQYFRTMTASNGNWGAWTYKHDVEFLAPGNTKDYKAVYPAIVTNAGALAFDIPKLNILTTSSHPITGVTAEFTIVPYNYDGSGSSINENNSTIALTNNANCLRVVVTPTTPLTNTNCGTIANASKLKLTQN